MGYLWQLPGQVPNRRDHIHVEMPGPIRFHAVPPTVSVPQWSFGKSPKTQPILLLFRSRRVWQRWKAVFSYRPQDAFFQSPGFNPNGGPDMASPK